MKINLYVKDYGGGVVFSQKPWGIKMRIILQAYYEGRYCSDYINANTKRLKIDRFT